MIVGLFYSLWIIALVVNILAFWFLRKLPIQRGLSEAQSYLGCVLWLVFFNGLSSLPVAASAKLFFNALAHAGAAPVPVFWVCFALRYANLIAGLHWKRLALLCAIPALLPVAVFTNSWHHLYWRSVAVTDGILIFQSGPLYYVWYSYTWICWFILMAILVGMLLFYKGKRLQIVLLLGGATVPWFIQVVFLLNGYLHNPGYNFMPILAGLGSVFVVLALVRGGLFQSELVSPRQLLQTGSPTIYLLLGGDLRILDASPQAIQEFEINPKQHPSADQVLAKNPMLREFLHSYAGESLSLQSSTFSANLQPIPESTAFLLRYENLQSTAPIAESASETPPELLGRLLDLFARQKVYLDPKLDMAKVCRLLQTNKKTLSELVNGTLGINFSRFISGYRVQEFERLDRLQKQPGEPQTTVEARALASGFASRSRFYEVLKESHNTPEGANMDSKYQKRTTKA